MSPARPRRDRLVTLEPARQIEADTGIEIVPMPLDLGHDPTWLAPCRCLIAEAGMTDPDMGRRSSDGAAQLMGEVPGSFVLL